VGAEIVFGLLEVLYEFKVYGEIRLKTLTAAYQLCCEQYSVLRIAGVAAPSRKRISVVLELNYLSPSALVRQRTRLLAGIACGLERYVASRTDGPAMLSSTPGNELLAAGVPEEEVALVPSALGPRKLDPSLNLSAWCDQRMRDPISMPSSASPQGCIPGMVFSILRNRRSSWC